MEVSWRRLEAIATKDLLCVFSECSVSLWFVSLRQLTFSVSGLFAGFGFRQANEHEVLSLVSAVVNEH